MPGVDGVSSKFCFKLWRRLLLSMGFPSQLWLWNTYLIRWIRLGYGFKYYIVCYFVLVKPQCQQFWRLVWHAFFFFFFFLPSLALDVQPSVAGSMVGARLGLSEHIQDTNAVFSLVLDDDDVKSIDEVSRKGKDLLRVIGDCGDEYRRWIQVCINMVLHFSGSYSHFVA